MRDWRVYTVKPLHMSRKYSKPVKRCTHLNKMFHVKDNVVNSSNQKHNVYEGRL